MDCIVYIYSIKPIDRLEKVIQAIPVKKIFTQWKKYELSPELSRSAEFPTEPENQT